MLAGAGTPEKKGMPARAGTTAAVGTTATAGKPALAGTQTDDSSSAGTQWSGHQ